MFDFITGNGLLALLKGPDIVQLLRIDESRALHLLADHAADVPPSVTVPALQVTPGTHVHACRRAAWQGCGTCARRSVSGEATGWPAAVATGAGSLSAGGMAVCGKACRGWCWPGCRGSADGVAQAAVEEADHKETAGQGGAEGARSWRRRLHEYLDRLFRADATAASEFHGLQACRCLVMRVMSTDIHNQHCSTGTL